MSVPKQAPSFTVTTASERVTLDDSGRARVSFTVTNTSPQALRGRLLALPIGAAKPEWFTVVGESVRDFAPDGAEQVVVELKVPRDTTPGPYSFRLDAVSAVEPDEDFTEGPSVAFDVKAPPPPPKKKKFPWWILAVVGAVVLLIIIGVVVWLLVRDTGTSVPRVVGETKATAENKLTDAGFTVKAQFVQVADREQHGLVQSQVPEGGTKQKKKTEVTISVGRPAVPNVKGLTQAQATAKLAEEDLGVAARNVGVPDPQQDGLVQSQDPAEGTLQPPGTVVRIDVGRNVEVPEVRQRPEQVAIAILRERGLSPNVIRIFGFPVGFVLSQTPPPGSRLPLGGVVIIRVGIVIRG
jgi:beta-lactam-binding protein with PASTA domain